MKHVIYVGRNAALAAAGLSDLPELAPRCHPRDAGAAVEAWRRGGGEFVCFSPYTLDHLRPSEARFVVCVAEDARHITVASLAQHPDWAAQREVVRVGEFWAMAGEAWVLA